MSFRDSSTILTEISVILQQASISPLLVGQATSQNHVYCAIPKRVIKNIKAIFRQKKLQKKITFHEDLGIITAIGKKHAIC